MNIDTLQETFMLVAKEIINSLNQITTKLDEIKIALSKSSGINMDSIKKMMESKTSNQKGSSDQNESFF